MRQHPKRGPLLGVEKPPELDCDDIVRMTEETKMNDGKVTAKDLKEIF